MSVFPPSMYGQPSYVAVPGYPPPRLPNVYQQQYYQPPPPQQPQQPPPPIYHADPASFRRDFTARLSNLTFNSRIHIQDLSLMAQDHPQFASVVAQCLDQHIRQVPSWMKLPAFYLFDAIAKNVYDGYAAVFSHIVVSLFIDTFFQVDASTRNKMEEMLLTWRTAGPDYTEIFGSDNQLQLQTAVWGEQSVASKPQVLSELQFTLGQMERALQANPSDRASEGHIHVLRQLKRLIERGVSQGELHQILDQLRSLARSALPPPIARPPRPPSQYYASLPPQRIRPYSQSPPVESPPIHASPPTPTSTAPSANLQNLFASLVNAGFLQSTSTSESTVVPAPTKVPTPNPEDGVELQTSATREYRTAILAETVKLTTADLARAKPQVVDYLYNRQSSQCKQCGIRFAETKLGKKKLDDHLDMHFRQNSKVDQGRGHSRSWFISLEDWVRDVSTDGKGKGRTDGPVNMKGDGKSEAELRGQHVVVPPGAEAQSISCPICKESLKSEFLEDDEEWVWRNAVKKDDKIYHATCHAEALASTSSLVARLRTEKASGSRSATPEVQPMSGVQSTLRSTPPPSQLRIARSKSPPQISPESKVVGIKRKVEHTDSNIARETTGTPPHKKVALPPVTIPTS